MLIILGAGYFYMKKVIVLDQMRFCNEPLTEFFSSRQH